MSIPVLVQVYDEVRRLAIAGSSVACGDFRLKKLIAPLQKAGEKAPVFAKVADAVNSVVESTEKTAAEALLSLSTLVNAILYTQGETSAAGKLEPIEMMGDGITPKRTPASLLKAVATAMTSTGSGRFEVIQESLAQNPFPDPRLLGPALEGLNGSYEPVCHLVENDVLPLYGKAIVPMVADKFDNKGGAADARRLSLLIRIDPKLSDKYIRDALKNGSREIKMLAIANLRDPKDVPFLIEQTAAKAGDVRKAAYRALAEIDNQEAAEAISEGIKKQRNDRAMSAATRSRHPTVLNTIVEETRIAVSELLATKPKDENLDARSLRLIQLLDALEERTDKITETLLLELFPQRAAIAKAESKNVYLPSALTILRRMAHCTDKTRELLISQHQSYDSLELELAVGAALPMWKPDRFYEEFHGYLTAAKTAKQKKNIAKEKAESISEVIAKQAGLLGNLLSQIDVNDAETPEPPLPVDPRWLDLAVKVECLPLVIQLARPKHAGAHKFLETEFKKFLKSKGETYEQIQTIQALVLSQHPQTADFVIQAMKKRSSYGISYFAAILSRLIPQLPKTAVPQLEALMAELPEVESDRYIVAVADLKKRS